MKKKRRKDMQRIYPSEITLCMFFICLLIYSVHNNESILNVGKLMVLSSAILYLIEKIRQHD